VLLAAAYVTTPVTVVVPGPASVKVVPSMVAGFIATLKAAVTIVLEHEPMAPPRGATEFTVGGVTVGLVPVLS
jgi:hypothetical protein